MYSQATKWIDMLKEGDVLSNEAYRYLLCDVSKAEEDYLFAQAQAVAKHSFGNKIFIRGLIEFSNHCRNDCYYCGIRKSNLKVKRYRLSKEEILSCCKEGYALGFRTFVLQGGEDGYYQVDIMCDIIHTIRENYPDCAITLSFGEQDHEAYQAYYEAGANRYLLRHETISEAHYAKLHPKEMKLAHRIACLQDLKAIGYQVGSGVMVGSPYQKIEYLIEDIKFLNELQPEMIGIGPYLPHEDTPFGKEAKGDLTRTLRLLAILRLQYPKALIPSTTALATIAPDGRERGILAGANVVMPNLSPLEDRENYLLYNDKACMGDEAAESLVSLNKRMQAIGYELSYERGDYKEELYV